MQVQRTCSLLAVTAGVTCTFYLHKQRCFILSFCLHKQRCFILSLAMLPVQDIDSHSMLVRYYYQHRIFMGFCCVSVEVLYLLVSAVSHGRPPLACGMAGLAQAPCYPADLPGR